MKFNYFNILLFSLSLNILLFSSQVYNQRNHILTINKATTTSRLLCECELYAPANYDNDPEMKAVMNDFDRQSSQRFEGYNERMIKNRQICKERCDRDIQKIILKDKIEKELAAKFVTLDTNIHINDIPTCVCEKSVADKVETICLKCEGALGGGVAPSWGLLNGLGYAAWKNYVAGSAAKAATKAGIEAAIEGLNSNLNIDILSGASLNPFINSKNFNDINALVQLLQNKYKSVCVTGSPDAGKLFCDFGNRVQFLKAQVQKVVTESTKAADSAKAAEVANFAPTTTTLTNAIIASIVAILIIILVMVIIYLILRYRRKKKMNKKHQYIKLLKE